MNFETLVSEFLERQIVEDVKFKAIRTTKFARILIPRINLKVQYVQTCFIS